MWDSALVGFFFKIVLSPAGGNTVERRAHDRKVVGSNLARVVIQWTELEEK